MAKKSKSLRVPMAYVATGAVSPEYLHMPNDCNICSTRMSPLPYSQTPGNMWAACCSYVAQLKVPEAFDRDMLQVQDAKSKCQGTDGFAAEHWVYLNPAAPCDLGLHHSTSDRPKSS